MNHIQAIQSVLPLIVGALGLFFVFIWLVKQFLYVCPPDKILIFSGREHLSHDGLRVGFRVVFGGRAWRIPILETVEEMDMRLISVTMSVQGAYSEGGIPLSLHAVANVKISSSPDVVVNAIERFLGRSRDEMARVAKETLEGHLRGVLATMTPEEVNEDRLKFAARLSDEAGDDLEKLGLQVDTLKIQHVSDERNYLESIGRVKIAEIIRAAEVAESDAQRAAKEAEAAASARAHVARTAAEANVAAKRNELRQITADLNGQACTEEERALGAAQAARAVAERELQEIRGELAQLRLTADVIIPADAERQVRELEAAGHASSIAEDGRAMAKAMEEIAQAWRETDGKAMDMVVLQNLEELFAQVANAASGLVVKEVHLVDGGKGDMLPAYLSAFPASVSALLHEVTRTLGVDMGRVLTGRDTPPPVALTPDRSA